MSKGLASGPSPAAQAFVVDEDDDHDEEVLSLQRRSGQRTPFPMRTRFADKPFVNGSCPYHANMDPRLHLA